MFIRVGFCAFVLLCVFECVFTYGYLCIRIFMCVCMCAFYVSVCARACACGRAYVYVCVRVYFTSVSAESCGVYRRAGTTHASLMSIRVRYSQMQCQYPIGHDTRTPRC